MEWNIHKELSTRWCNEGKIHAKKLNELLFIGEGRIENFPKETRFDMAEKVISIIKEANKNNEIEELRENFPPSDRPFMNIIKNKGQAITSVLLLDNENLIFKIGENNGYGKLFTVNGKESKVIKDALYAGCSYNKKVYAIAYYDYIETYDKNGKCLYRFNWPKGTEGYAYDFDIDINPEMFKLTNLVPFSDGKKVLLVSYRGVFILNDNKTIRLYPRDYEIENLCEDELSKLFIDGIYGTISPNEVYIALGTKNSEHIILDAEDDYMEVAGITPKLNNTSNALFDESSEYIIFNSYSPYHGTTIQFPTWDIYDEDEFIENQMELDYKYKFSLGVSRDEQYILGDVDGYIRAFNIQGEEEWQYYIGSTISGIDISEDGNKLLVGTYSGILYLLELDSQKKNDYSISTANITELKRWIIWKDEKHILQW